MAFGVKHGSTKCMHNAVNGTDERFATGVHVNESWSVWWLVR